MEHSVTTVRDVIQHLHYTECNGLDTFMVNMTNTCACYYDNVKFTEQNVGYSYVFERSVFDTNKSIYYCSKTSILYSYRGKNISPLKFNDRLSKLMLHIQSYIDYEYDSCIILQAYQDGARIILWRAADIDTQIIHSRVSFISLDNPWFHFTMRLKYISTLSVTMMNGSLLTFGAELPPNAMEPCIKLSLN